jgi:hypothetical protein
MILCIHKRVKFTFKLNDSKEHSEQANRQGRPEQHDMYRTIQPVELRWEGNGEVTEYAEYQTV